MSDDIKNKWDLRYKSPSKTITHAAKVLSENRHLLPEEGKALDLACGRGGNALLLAEQGMDTEAWDISTVALQQLQEQAAAKKYSIKTVARDVENNPPDPESFDVIVISYFLNRNICPAIVDALKPGGLLFYQTFCRGKLSERGPSNPDFLLARNELLKLFSDLDTVFYREDNRCGNLEVGDRDSALFIGQKV